VKFASQVKLPSAVVVEIYSFTLRFIAKLHYSLQTKFATSL